MISREKFSFLFFDYLINTYMPISFWLVYSNAKSLYILLSDDLPFLLLSSQSFIGEAGLFGRWKKCLQIALETMLISVSH
jgi:hypothetical protein